MQMSLKIHDLQSSEKPRERLLNYGESILSDAELLAIILRSGGVKGSSLSLASVLLKKFSGLNGVIFARYEELVGIKDVGPAKATSIKAISEIALRLNMDSKVKKFKLSGPRDVFVYMKKSIYKKEKEHLYVISLDSRNFAISADLVSVGTVNETLIHPREVFREAIYKNATYIILAHNHPSGDTSPSEEDIQVTHRLVETGKIIGIPLVDHVILSNDSYTSLKSKDLINKEDKQ